MAKSADKEAFRRGIQERLKAARVAAGFTQEQFADELGIDVKTYAKYESRSKSVLPIEFWPHVCTVLDLDPWFFMTGAGEEAVRGRIRRVK